MKKTIFIILTIACIGLSTAAAQVGIGTETPHISAKLDLTSSSQGFLPPRMTEAERNNINTPATGLMLYCTNCGTNGELQVYNGTNWTNLLGGAATAAPPPSVTNPITGKVWMDRNLGATQVATSSTDAASYGDLYQWGRGTDGHQIRTSGTTTTLSTTDTPGHGDFITIISSPNDWRNPQNDNLWQGVNAVNNPCPSGYRLPTVTELDSERASWVQAPISSTNNAAGAFASPLKLPMAGRRSFSDGLVDSEGSLGGFWSSTVNGINLRVLRFFQSDAGIDDYRRAHGFSVRCIKD
ncbi:MAG: fibrobacter succinogenes major paralogous domain-containing protein [Flavobacteriaceae bacterium]|nr:fibrobacter succinogenes major paralogous domain-containing protein [Flavobacteriaceae bacterium]